MKTEMGSEAGPSWESPLSATPLPDLGDFEAEQGSTPTLHGVKQAANVTFVGSLTVSFKSSFSIF